MSVIVTTAAFLKDETRHIHSILHGALFIYPTDTIYGIGCDATNDTSVQRIRTIKQRDAKPFSVIAPSKEWITKNCIVPAAGTEWLAKLPGPYTLILRLKNKSCVAQSVTTGTKTLGVRIPAHWISDIAATARLPLVTTSVNIAGAPFATSIKDIDSAIIDAVAFTIDEGTKEGRPSTLVDLTGTEAIVKSR